MQSDTKFDYNAEFENVDREFYYDGELGAIYSNYNTIFRVWSPKADSVILNIYDSGIDGRKMSSYNMGKNQNNVWEYIVDGDLNGCYYTYTVSIYGQSRETIDIYAKSSGINGLRGMVVDTQSLNPQGWNEQDLSNIPDKTNAILYELHVRDFSIDRSASFVYRGKFKAFTETGITNKFGDTVGIDYIKDLGVTHIHLLPIFDFSSVDEGSSLPQYNWGYDPLNYNVLEGSYSIYPYDGTSRIKEFKELVMAVHQRGMGVIMDVVYNHTQSGEDSPFSKIFPHYYYRHIEQYYSNGSGCGNEFASERSMARKFICDSLCYLAKEYKLDGFRFDLMGLFDIQTMNYCAEKLRQINSNIILYGEGWTGGDSPLSEDLRAVKRNARQTPSISYFSDDFRDTVKGSAMDAKDWGYINGDNEESSELMKSLLIGGIYNNYISRGWEYCWTDDPMQTINYVEAHDNLTFYDKLKLSMGDIREEELQWAIKIGAGLVFFAQGVPFIQAGQEFMRSKPLTTGGYDENSYCAPDVVNSLKWNKLNENKHIVDYYKGLIKIRKKFREFRMTSADEIREKISFDNIKYGAFIMNIDGFKLIVNPLNEILDIHVDGRYDVYVNKNDASENPMYDVDHMAKVEPRSIMLIKKVY